MSSESSSGKSADPLEILKTSYRSSRERLQRINSRKVAEAFPLDLWDVARLKARDEFFQAAVELADHLIERGDDGKGIGESAAAISD